MTSSKHRQAKEMIIRRKDSTRPDLGAQAYPAKLGSKSGSMRHSCFCSVMLPSPKLAQHQRRQSSVVSIGVAVADASHSIDQLIYPKQSKGYAQDFKACCREQSSDSFPLEQVREQKRKKKPWTSTCALTESISGLTEQNFFDSWWPLLKWQNFSTFCHQLYPFFIIF